MENMATSTWSRENSYIPVSVALWDVMQTYIQWPTLHPHSSKVCITYVRCEATEEDKGSAALMWPGEGLRPQGMSATSTGTANPKWMGLEMGEGIVMANG